MTGFREFVNFRLKPAPIIVRWPERTRYWKPRVWSKFGDVPECSLPRGYKVRVISRMKLNVGLQLC